MKLPKDLEADPRHDTVAELLRNGAAPLWEGGRTPVATVPLTASLVLVLRHALHVGLASPGLDLIAEKLAAEQNGIDAVNRKAGTAPGAPRVSRLLFVANDGSTRFYRDCDGLLARYDARLLACRIDLPGTEFGEAIAGAPKLMRCLLVSDKRTVSRALLALLEP